MALSGASALPLEPQLWGWFTASQQQQEQSCSLSLSLSASNMQSLSAFMNLWENTNTHKWAESHGGHSQTHTHNHTHKQSESCLCLSLCPEDNEACFGREPVRLISIRSCTESCSGDGYLSGPSSTFPGERRGTLPHRCRLLSESCKEWRETWRCLTVLNKMIRLDFRADVKTVELYIPTLPLGVPSL